MLRIKIDKNKYLALIMELYNNINSITYSHFVELLKLYLEYKNVVRIVVTLNEYSEINRISKDQAIFIERSNKKFASKFINDLGDSFVTTVDWNDHLGETFAIFVSFDCSLAKLNADYESNNYSFNELGRLLQIPECCIDEYSRVIEGEDWLKIWLGVAENFSFHNHKANHLSSYISGCSLHGDYLPCSISCKLSIEKANDGIKTLKFFELFGLLEKAINYSKFPLIAIDNYILFFSSINKIVDKKSMNILPNSIFIHGKIEQHEKEIIQKSEKIEITYDLIYFSGFKDFYIDTKNKFFKVINFK